MVAEQRLTVAHKTQVQRSNPKKYRSRAKKKKKHPTEDFFDSIDKKSLKGELVRYLNRKNSGAMAGHSKSILNALVIWRSTSSQSRIRNRHLYKTGFGDVSAMMAFEAYECQRV